MPNGVIKCDEESVVTLKLDSDRTLALMVYNPDETATNYLSKKVAISLRDRLSKFIDKM